MSRENDRSPIKLQRRKGAGAVVLRGSGRRRRRRKILWRRFLLMLCSLALVLLGGGRLIAYLSASRSARQTNAQLEKQYEAAQVGAAQTESDLRGDAGAASAVQGGALQVGSTIGVASATASPRPALLDVYQYRSDAMLPEMGGFYLQNSDLVGWVKIPGVLSLPVVYRDNSYYLTHDFYGKKSSSGTLFLDAQHPMKTQTQYLVIHGHNMHDGGMFGHLVRYRKMDYLKAHGLVGFSTLCRREYYAVVAVLVVPGDVSDDGYIAYTGTPRFETESRFDAFVDGLLSRSLYQIPIDVCPADALLTLSTCLDEDRLIVVCRRLRDGETEADMQAALDRSVRRAQGE